MISQAVALPVLRLLFASKDGLFGMRGKLNVKFIFAQKSLRKKSRWKKTLHHTKLLLLFTSEMRIGRREIEIYFAQQSTFHVIIPIWCYFIIRSVCDYRIDGEINIQLRGFQGVVNGFGHFRFWTFVESSLETEVSIQSLLKALQKDLKIAT